MTPASELRAAADTLDRAADAATSDLWGPPSKWIVGNAADAAFIAVMDPALAKTVAAPADTGSST